jgi:hypothetical protein
MTTSSWKKVMVYHVKKTDGKESKVAEIPVDRVHM